MRDAAAVPSEAPRSTRRPAVVRPEDRGGDAGEYYDGATADAYTNANAQIQRELTATCLRLLGLDDATPSLIADVGCGSGLSGEELARRGHAWVGVDLSAAMLTRATRAPSEGVRAASEGAVLRGDFAQGLPFRERAFDGCVSVSAAQWLCVGDDAARRAKLHRFFAALRRCLRPGARAVLQIYPDTVRDTRTMEDAAAREQCVAVAVTAHPHRTPNKKIFLCVRRDRTDDADGTQTDAATAPSDATETPREPRDPPRCPLGWPHDTSCAAAWRRRVRVGDDETIPGDDAGDARDEREHLGICRRLLRVLRRARTLDDDEGEETTASKSTSTAGPSASSMAMDGDPTARVAVRDLEVIVRDGTACACARVGVVTASRVAAVVDPPAAATSDASHLPAEERERSRARPDRKRRRTPGALDESARLRRVAATVHIAQSHAEADAGDARETTRLEATAFDAFALRQSKGTGPYGVVAVECVVRAVKDESPAETATRAARATCAALRAVGLNPTCADALFDEASSSDGRTGPGRVQVWCLHLPEARPDGTPSRGPSSREMSALARLNVALVDAFKHAGDANRER